MMIKTATFLAAVSTIAILMPADARAEGKSANEIRAEASTTGSVKKDVKKAWADVKHDAKEVRKQFDAFFLSDDENVPAKKMSYATVSSAGGMIGSPVVNYKGVRVGTVHDIIISSSGLADMVVIADGEFPGFDGKLVGYLYGDISKKNADGDVIVPLTEDMIKRASEFSYEADTGKSLVRYVPAGGYSVKKILKGNVLDDMDKKVGAVDDIYFKDGEADLIIIGFDKVLGMGGNKVAANYDPTNIAFDGDSLHVKLTHKQSVALTRYKKAMAH